MLIDDYKQQHKENIASIKDIMDKRHHSLSFNQLTPNALYEININHLPGEDVRYETLESRTICISQNVSELFDRFEITPTRCSAFVINADLNDGCIGSISAYAKEKGLRSL